MVKHIVMWTLKDETEHGTKAQVAAKIKDMLEALNGVVPTLAHLEVSTDIFQALPGCDVVLYSEFADRAALEAYQQHSEHQKCVAFVREVVADRMVVDYEV